MKKGLVFILFFILSFSVFPQSKEGNTSKIEIGLEFEKYPVGIIPTITSNVFLKKDVALRFRVGGNFADRGKTEFNDSETAKGYGASAGVVKYFRVGNGAITIGFLTDFWCMKTNWTDGTFKGTTTNLVVQPWISTGFLYRFSSDFNSGIIVGFGREINTFNKGEEVGQGYMGSISLQMNYKLN
ncbi:MAG: hypothetical protein V4548_11215 [Bacteroidota bacterium]